MATRRLTIRNLCQFYFYIWYHVLIDESVSLYFWVFAIEGKGGYMRDNIYENQVFVGPLNLNRQTRAAETVMGTKLSLDAKEFDSLDMLAAREGEALAFDLIYAVVWDNRDGICRRDEARLGLDNLISQIDKAGEGFMKINYTSEAGYTFQTCWSHNWKSQSSIFPLGLGKKEMPKVIPRQKKRKNGTLFIKITLAAASVVMMIFLPLNGRLESDIGYYFFDDIPVPLAALPDFENNIIFPAFHNQTIAVNSGNMTIELYNYENNNCWFMFEIILTDAREILYTSELLAPGTRIETVVQTGLLETGEHEAVLNVRAYSLDNFTEIYETSTKFIIVAN